MAAGSLTVTITVPDIVAAPNGIGDTPARTITVGLLAQAAQAIGSSFAMSGNLTWPPGPAPAIVGSWTYVAPT